MARQDLNPGHLNFMVVLPHDMKSPGKAFPIFVRLGKGLRMQIGCFFYPNLVSGFADKAGSLAGLYKALGLKKRKNNS